MLLLVLFALAMVLLLTVRLGRTVTRGLFWLSLLLLSLDEATGTGCVEFVPERPVRALVNGLSADESMVDVTEEGCLLLLFAVAVVAVPSTILTHRLTD